MEKSEDEDEDDDDQEEEEEEESRDIIALAGIAIFSFLFFVYKQIMKCVQGDSDIAAEVLNVDDTMMAANLGVPTPNVLPGPPP